MITQKRFLHLGVQIADIGKYVKKTRRTEVNRRKKNTSEMRGYAIDGNETSDRVITGRTFDNW